MYIIINRATMNPDPKEKSLYIPIHRPCPVGNPYHLINTQDQAERDKVCDDYENWFNDQIVNQPEDSDFFKYIELIRKIHRENGKVYLVCFCAPKRCHGETIKRFCEEQDEKENVDGSTKST